MKFQLRRTKEEEKQRDIRANDSTYNAQFKYANNFIHTSKYNLLTFLPINLLEQFRRLANFYFLCLLLLQFVPVISSLNPITTLLPLLSVLMITALKDGYDDIQRHISDNQVNHRFSSVLRDGELKEEHWQKVLVGDVIKMTSNQFVAADMLLLSTSEPNGLCYVETSELDGETNLKVKQCLPDVASLEDDMAAISSFDGAVRCEPPNNNLNSFQGTLEWNGKKYALDNDNVLLRGCILRNTAWCYCLVVFAGSDTKLMQNSGETVFKRTSIDRLLNTIILAIVLFLLLLCLFCAIVNGIWEDLLGFKFQTFLPWDTVVPPESGKGATVIASLVFFSYIILLNTVVPISLYVSVEVIRLFQSFLINWDKEMKYLPSNTYAKARTTTLNEELGQVQYIFSDKTGTLTQNMMTFNKCSIDGTSYGDIDDDDQESEEPIDFSSNSYAEPSFVFYDRKMQRALQARDASVTEFFLLLSLCHTIMPEEKDGVLVYQAQSPDEGALVSAARNFGFVFKSRTPSSINVVINGEERTYELLCILDFNNVRKRMSVIVRRDGKLRLYCKGADSIIYARLKDGQETLTGETSEHMDCYAGEGLRTLCLAMKDLDEDYFQDWWARYQQAATDLENREKLVNDAFEEIEKDLVLLGASAIEDKLQDGVPETIANLAQAGIKIWVLTGDKQETAINIGYSCQLLTDEMRDPFIVDGEDHEIVERQLREALSHFPDEEQEGVTVNPSDTSVPASSLVVNGHSLVFALDESLEQLLLAVASQCRAVICCRVTPLQKANVVELVKKYKKAVTLSIGDGANDVSMIKTAHIGVGISGQEGLQAVLSSDYSIAQFRYLERLLLVHGRWSYFRMCKFLKYFFYKNFAYTFCQFWYAFFAGFSAQTAFGSVFISSYNMIYTAFPVLALGAFDQDVNDQNSIRYPKLYTPGLKDMWFSKKIFLQSALHGVFTSFALFFIIYGTYYNNINPEGHVLSDFYTFGSVLSSTLVIVVTAQMGLDTEFWTIFNHVTIWGSLVLVYLMQYLINRVFKGDYIGSLSKAMAEPSYYLSSLLAVVVTLAPVMLWRFWETDVHPTLTAKARYKQREEASGKPRARRRIPLTRRTSSMRRRDNRRSFRSGYAFSHQEGFGRLITEGKIVSTGHMF